LSVETLNDLMASIEENKKNDPKAATALLKKLRESQIDL
jgi:hypothetical protein